MLRVLPLAAAAAAAAAPLLPKAIQPLAPGATRGAGWLSAQLELQAAGLTGVLPDFWSYLTESAWLGGPGFAPPNQFVPYYLNGLVPLSFQVADPSLAATRESMIDYILAQNASGWLGPEVVDPEDYFSKYPAVEA
eukprot:CAMPEP_0119264996 /NCGR_PEP_ID=MMETSP1329-20130426/3923_1 /TAXON_ID=114041 /ORGANISM="Genus nov. species nov., Strain RCC1024" /LENGTH=135 /DNA_ID=CAMNT_0007264791 /DNA_START=365 /DNA_END=768 /DNA_ORIENTATION=-